MALPAKAAVRAADVLNLVAAHPGERFTLSEISGRLGIGNASIHGVLSALTEAGLLVRNSTKGFRLGPTAAAIGTIARHQDPVLDHAIRAAELAASELDCQVLLKKFDGTSIVVLLALGGRQQLLPAERSDAVVAGAQLSAAAPHGVVFMASAPPHELLRWLAWGRVVPTSVEGMALRAEVERAGLQGWAANDRSVEAGFSARGDGSLALCAVDALAPGEEPDRVAAQLLDIIDRAKDPGSMHNRPLSVA